MIRYLSLLLGTLFFSVSASATISPITGITTVCLGFTTALSDATPGGSWSSGNPARASVDATGTVTGVSSGSAVITYTVGSAYVTTTVSVNGVAAISGSDIACVGSPFTLTPMTLGGSWTSGNPSLATVSTSGVVTPLSPGVVNIYYTIGGCYSFQSVTVNTTSTPISGSSSVCIGTSTTLTDATSAFWSSSNTSIATVGSSSGVVTGVSSGTVTISYGSGSCTVTKLMTVNAAPTAITGSSSVCAGGTLPLSDATGGGSWSSSNTAIATVSSSGVVTGVASGTATITYSIGSCYAVKPVTVTTGISAVSGCTAMCIGTTCLFTDATTGGTWSSGNTSIATVSTGGMVTALSPGTVTIYYTAGACSASFALTVSGAPVAITGGSSLCSGSTLPLSDASSGGTWSSSNTSVATVGSSGVVTGIAAGTVNITYTIGSCYVYKPVTVTAGVSTISGCSSVCIGNTCLFTDATPGGAWSSSNSLIASVSSGGLVSSLSLGTATIYYTLGSCSASFVVTTGTAPTAIIGGSSLCASATLPLSDATPGGTWSSSNTSVATVGSTGVVAGVSTGTVNITYAIGGCYTYKPVTVIASPSPISGTSTVCAGFTTALSDATPGGAWSSSNTAIATVGSTGIVTGITGGTVTINYGAGSCSVSETVTVNGMALISGSNSVCIGSTIALTGAAPGGSWTSGGPSVATVSSSGVVTAISAGVVNIYYTIGGCYSFQSVTVAATASISGGSMACTGSPLTLTGTPSGGAWSSGSTSIATVGSSGVVTGITPGITSIYYTVGGCGTASRPVTVNTSPALISGSSVVCMGSIDALSDGTPGGTWSSDNTSVATVTSSGAVTGVAGGTASISYSIGSCSTSKIVTVSPTATISGGSAVCIGSAITLTASAPGGSWSSGSPTIATVSSTGVVTGLAPGVVSIYYIFGSCFSSVTVTVNATAVISGGSNVCIGSPLSLSGAPSGGAWSSSNPSVAIAGSSTGIIAGIAPGTAVIFYTVPGCSATSEIVSVNTAPAAITGSSSICASLATTLSDITPGGTWSSDNTAVATVTSTGVVTGISGGTADISYSIGGCSASTVVTVNGISSLSGSTTVCAGYAITLTPSTLGGTWSSGSTSIATVSSGGLVTGIAPGIVSIYYSIGGCFSTISITVNATATITGGGSICSGSTATLMGSPSGGSWSSANPSLATVTSGGVVTGLSGGYVNIYYTATGCGIATQTETINTTPAAITGGGAVCVGSTLGLSDVTPGGTWSSSNPTVAPVSIAGVVTGMASGSATISYGSGGCYAYQPVTVNATASISGSSSACTGSSITLTASAPGGSWSSGSPSVATVSPAGLVTGVSAGVVNIYYTIGGCYAFQPVTVNATPGTISGASHLCLGTSVTFTDGVSGGTWSSSNTSIAAVGSSTGLVTGIGTGTVTISYTEGSCYTTLTATVSAGPAAISGSSSICPGLTITLTDGMPGGSWTSSNTSIATVGSSGIVTGVASGAATITYTAGFCYVVKPVTVNVGPAPIAGSSSVATGHTITLTDAVSGGTWSSSSTFIASVTSAGVVTGGFPGIATISYAIGSCSASKLITVSFVPAANIGTTTTTTTISASSSNGTSPRTSPGSSPASAEEAGTIRMYPNPSSGTITVLWEQQVTGIANVVLTDISGREVYHSQVNISDVSGSASLDLSDLKNGIYLLKIYNDKINYMGKINIAH